MTQVRTPAGSGVGTGTGAEYLANTTQLPTARTFDEVPGRVNRLDNVDEYKVAITGSSTGEVLRFVALDNCRIIGMTVNNGSTACDGTNGWRVLVQNEDQTDAEMADFGMGSATEAAKANDKKAVAASAISYFSNSLTATTVHASKGQVVTVDVTEDGTAGAADLVFHVVYLSQGYAA